MLSAAAAAMNGLAIKGDAPDTPPESIGRIKLNFTNTFSDQSNLFFGEVANLPSHLVWPQMQERYSSISKIDC